MGMDLILNTLAYKRDTTLDWEAGRTSIRNQTFDEDDVIESYLYDGEYQPGEEGWQDDYREYLVHLLFDLEKGLQEDRAINEIVFGDWIIVLCGGSSWGDSPSRTFDRIQDLLEHFETALAPVGFDWPERS